MDTVLSLVAMLVLSIPAGFALALFASRGPELLSGFFGPAPPDGWPQGVEEEDPSFVQTFRLGPASAVPPRGGDDPDVEAVVALPTQRLAATVRRRS